MLAWVTNYLTSARQMTLRVSAGEGARYAHHRRPSSLLNDEVLFNPGLGNMALNAALLRCHTLVLLMTLGVSYIMNFVLF